MPLKHTRDSPVLVKPESSLLQTVADLLKHSRKIIAITGAGISTAAGIPVGLPDRWSDDS